MNSAEPATPQPATPGPLAATGEVELRIGLQTGPEQRQRLLDLQRAFAEVCNALTPLVQQTRCWNRVTLHHLTYRQLRERFPAIGSQMVCNAIYSVSRTSRQLFQSPDSPFNIARLDAEGKRLPLLQFSDGAPVYFDRHTLSLKGGRLSMYTLDGRIRFDLALPDAHEQAFHAKKLREVVLNRTTDGAFELRFRLSDGNAPADEADDERAAEIPEYVLIQETS
jgi:hypothetical protein